MRDLDWGLVQQDVDATGATDVTRSPTTQPCLESIDAAAIADAAQAMEALRRACDDLELAARQTLADAQLLGERQADDEALAAVDDAAARAQREAEEQMRREVEAQDAADHRSRGPQGVDGS